MSNPRYSNGAKRREIRRWVLSTQDACGICGKPVDKSIKTPHPLSPEVDEIIPVSKGGSPYERDNVQLAHRICNQRKGNKTGTNAVLPVQKRVITTSRHW